MNPAVSLRPGVQIALVHEATAGFNRFLAPSEAIVAPVGKAAPPGLVIAPVNAARVVKTVDNQRLKGCWESMRRDPNGRGAYLTHHGRWVAKKPSVRVDIHH